MVLIHCLEINIHLYIHYDYRHLWTDIGAPPEITQSTKELYRTYRKNTR